MTGGPVSAWPFEGLGAGVYGALLIDPPWRFHTYGHKVGSRCPDAPMSNRPERHYATMTIEDIAALQVGALAAKNCALFLWVPDSLLAAAFEIGADWGFAYKTVAFYWAKLRKADSTRGRMLTDPAEKLFPMGTGYWTRANPEQCLLFTRGEPRRQSPSVRKLIVAPRREHSRKPAEQYERIEALIGGVRKAELFAREYRPGWESWGLELGKFDAAEAAE